MPPPHEIDINQAGDKWRVTEKRTGRELGSFNTHEEAVMHKIKVIRGESGAKRPTK